MHGGYSRSGRSTRRNTGTISTRRAGSNPLRTSPRLSALAHTSGPPPLGLTKKWA